MADVLRYCCPKWDNGTGLLGCGSTDLRWDADEQLFDCMACGLWFTKAEAGISVGTQVQDWEVKCTT